MSSNNGRGFGRRQISTPGTHPAYHRYNNERDSCRHNSRGAEHGHNGETGGQCNHSACRCHDPGHGRAGEARCRGHRQCRCIGRRGSDQDHRPHQGLREGQTYPHHRHHGGREPTVQYYEDPLPPMTQDHLGAELVFSIFYLAYKGVEMGVVGLSALWNYVVDVHAMAIGEDGKESDVQLDREDGVGVKIDSDEDGDTIGVAEDDEEIPVAEEGVKLWMAPFPV